MKASVIIPTKNPGPVFTRVLPAVLDQETAFPFEVLIVDSGSTDGTVEYVGRMRDDRVRLHSIDSKSFGHGRTRNLGISMTSGEYAVLITHDATPADKHWLAALVEAAEADGEVAGVFGRHLAYPDASPFTRRELELHFSGFASCPQVRLDDPDRYAADPGYRQFLHFFSDNNALIRRSVWEKIPYPDVDFAEDQIWAQRIIEAGYRKAYAHDAAVFHSHDYSLAERLQRSFDESYAFRALFGYLLCPGMGSLLKSWLSLTLRDLRHASAENLWRLNRQAVLGMPFDNLMRVLGHYLGAKGDAIPPSLRLSLSSDKRLQLGLRASGWNSRQT